MDSITDGFEVYLHIIVVSLHCTCFITLASKVLVRVVLNKPKNILKMPFLKANLLIYIIFIDNKTLLGLG